MSESSPTADFCPSCAQLREKIAALSAELAATRAELAATRAELATALAENAELKKRLARLEAQVGRSSSNSDQPPSSDGPRSRRRTKTRLSKRHRGGQPGRKGVTRTLLPPDQLDRIEDCRPDACEHCGEVLIGDDAHPERHQVTELPPVRPEVTEYRMHGLTCDRCGETTWGTLPEGVSPSAFGPRLHALVSLLVGLYRLPRRQVRELMLDCFGVEMSLGSVSNIEQTMSTALEAPFEDALGYVHRQPVVGADETGWRRAGARQWLWAAVSRLVAVFLIRPSRSSRVARELLGPDFPGRVVGVDRWSAYLWLMLTHRQVCWAHLIRDFERLAESPGAGAIVGRALRRCAPILFHAWHRVRDGTTTRRELYDYVFTRMSPLIRRLLEKGIASNDEAVVGTCRALLAVEPAMWTFVCVEGVEPTNNDTERELRPAVIWRKISFGTQSEGGDRFVERILTARASLRRQGRNVLDYLAAACHAVFSGHPAPALVPPSPSPA